MIYPEYVAKIIDRLESRGFEAYIVGGSVRDFIIDRTPGDFDVTTSALPEQTLEAFSDFRTIPTGLKHGTVTVLSEGHPIEITTFRIDGEYRDARHPDEVIFTDSITEDLSRRDFTVNAMAFSERRGLVDPFGGREDIAARIIRAVGEPKKRFSEDALRIMRAFRFASQLTFKIDSDTLAAAIEQKCGLEKIARERIAAEFIKLICAKDPSYSLKLISENKIFEYILGDHEPREETFEALGKAPADPIVRLGIIMSECETEKIKEVLSRLRLSAKMINGSSVVAKEARSRLSGSAADARRFIGRCGVYSSEVAAAADALGNLDADFARYIKENGSAEVCTTIGGLAINGSHLIKLGFDGRAVGATLSYLLEKVIEDPENNTPERLVALALEFKTDKINGDVN